MKKLFPLFLAAVLLAAMLAGCTPQGSAEGTQQPGTDPTPTQGADQNSPELNLMDMYTVKDPEGVEYDQRTALYMPVLESEESYSEGLRHLFTVYYGKDGKGVYMYTVEIFATEEQATAYQEAAENGKVDGTAVITESNADFFAAMESFIPDLKTWIDNSMASGMIEVE